LPPRAPDRIRERGRRQGAAVVGVREALEGLPANPVLARGSVSRVRQRLQLCARRVGEGRSGILEDDPPDLIGEKVNRTVEELLSAAPERAGFFCRSSLRTESSCASEWVRRRVDRSQ